VCVFLCVGFSISAGKNFAMLVVFNIRVFKHFNGADASDRIWIEHLHKKVHKDGVLV